jgi:hypothetical protein
VSRALIHIRMGIVANVFLILYVSYLCKYFIVGGLLMLKNNIDENYDFVEGFVPSYVDVGLC